ncbi:MAG: hypothetical protein FWD55_07925 [Propionibacteriaceae bacterium]|nr:hypothetical protein [Propionibacteriaceae bacterium]
MQSLQALAERFGCEDLAAAFPEIDIPVLTGAQRQGDVLVLPSPLPAKWPRKGHLPLDPGVVVLSSEDTDHTHTLYGDGQVFFTEGMSYQRIIWWRRMENNIAWLNVPANGEAFLMHSDEHGALGIGPGTYQILAQQEFGDGWMWSSVLD